MTRILVDPVGLAGMASAMDGAAGEYQSLASSLGSLSDMSGLPSGLMDAVQTSCSNVTSSLLGLSAELQQEASNVTWRASIAEGANSGSIPLYSVGQSLLGGTACCSVLPSAGTATPVAPTIEDSVVFASTPPSMPSGGGTTITWGGPNDPYGQLFADTANPGQPAGEDGGIVTWGGANDPYSDLFAQVSGQDPLGGGSTTSIAWGGAGDPYGQLFSDVSGQGQSSGDVFNVTLGSSDWLGGGDTTSGITFGDEGVYAGLLAGDAHAPTAYPGPQVQMDPLPFWRDAFDTSNSHGFLQDPNEAPPPDLGSTLTD